MESKNFILEYYQGIQDGSIVVGKWIRLAYEYIIRGLQERSFFFSQKRANLAIAFIESYCHHHEGALAPQLLKLELWQKALISCIFGILDTEGNRQFREVVLVEARKNGKTLLAAAIAECCVYIDGEYGARIYFAAPKLEQANLCFEALHQMILQEPELAQMTKKRRTDLYVEATNTTAKPLAFSAKKSDGLNVHLAVADEFANWQGAAGIQFYEVIKSSFGARRQPLLLAISTAGYTNEGIYDELIKRCTRLLLGESKEKRLLPLLYMIDEVDRWNDLNELRKSNPNLGVSVTVDYLLEEIAVAEGSLSKKAEFVAKYCNIKQSSSQAWLPSQAVDRARGEPLRLEDFRGTYCVGGIDLSRTTDLTACCIVIERDGMLNVFAKFFLPRAKIDEATARDGLPYRQYIERGILQESGENFVDYEDCFAWFRGLVEQYEILPLWVGYDRYNALQLTQTMEQYGFHMDSVFQGENLTGVINLTEGELLDGRLRIGDNDLLAVHLLNAAVKSTAATGRRRLIKLSANAHVDGAAALLDAMCVRVAHGVEIGEQLKNIE